MADTTNSIPPTAAAWCVRAVRIDWWLAAGVFVATVAYLVSLPRGLDLGDESFLLYDAKRIRDGEIIYRDFFQFVTPLTQYTIAALFWLFGTSMATARAGMAVVHAITAMALYAVTRQLGVRRVFAVSVPLAYVGLCQTIWPVASCHWFSTCYTVLLLWMLVAEPATSRRRWPFAEGLMGGLLVGTMQQKGVVVVAGICVLFAVHAMLDQRYGAPGPWRQAAARLAWFAVGIAVVMLPLLAIFAGLAGAGPVYDALVRFPLENYRSSLRTVWGATFLNAGQAAVLSFPRLLRFAPLAVLPPLLQGVIALIHNRDREKVRPLASLLMLSGAAPLSIWYFPSLVHIAFIAAPFAICAAVGLEWVAGGLRRVGRIGNAVTTLSGVGVVVVLIVHLANAAAVLRQMYPVPYESAFGRVDLVGRRQVAILEEVRARLDRKTSRTLFCYRHMTGVYLLTDARNPTPYHYLDPQVSPPAHVRKTLEILAREDIPYAVMSPYIPRNDPIGHFLYGHYRPVDEPAREKLGGLRGFRLFERLDD